MIKKKSTELSEDLGFYGDNWDNLEFRLIYKHEDNTFDLEVGGPHRISLPTTIDMDFSAERQFILDMERNKTESIKTISEHMEAFPEFQSQKNDQKNDQRNESSSLWDMMREFKRSTNSTYDAIVIKTLDSIEKKVEPILHDFVEKFDQLAAKAVKDRKSFLGSIGEDRALIESLDTIAPHPIFGNEEAAEEFLDRMKGWLETGHPHASYKQHLENPEIYSRHDEPDFYGM